ncbi:MAG TPA: hypothetical protein PKJ68_05450, partial [Candidatus Woesebacteria bacterium]|nr:hypothetical protein [Candidatus Woesebacteria bacterium]
HPREGALIMTYIAYVKRQNELRKHSAWSSEKDCLKQLQILNEHGYCASWDSIPATLDVPNGHYF